MIGSAIGRILRSGSRTKWLHDLDNPNAVTFPWQILMIGVNGWLNARKPLIDSEKAGFRLFKAVKFSMIFALPVGTDQPPADVAELADALDSGSSGRNPVEVQVLSSALRK